jgi:hypothetical protein
MISFSPCVFLTILMLALVGTSVDGTFAPIVLGPHRRLLSLNLRDDDTPTFKGHYLGH